MEKAINLKAGDLIYQAGQTGPSYKVLTGTVRLDHAYASHKSVFVNLAIAGDLMGAEVLLRKPYVFDAYALTDFKISIWQ